MGKLMEIIEKSPDFKNGSCYFRFLDTNFSQLTRKLGSNPEANFKTAKIGDMLSKELLVSLNQEQLLLKDKVILWQNAYNNWIDSIKSKVTTAEHFEYTFSSVVDYSNKYIPGTTLTDYYLLTEFINAEKELYEFGHYWGKNHMLDLLVKIKEWSKNKDYGSCVGEIYCQYEIRNGENYNWYLKTNTHDLKVKLEHEGGRVDFCDLTVSDVSKIPVGETATVIARCDWDYYDYGSMWAECIMKITRQPFGVEKDDGQIIYSAEGTGNRIDIYEGDGRWRYVYAFDNIRKPITIISRSGNGSPHFDIDNPTLLDMKARILL